MADVKVIRVLPNGLKMMAPPAAGGVYFITQQEQQAYVKIGMADSNMAARIAKYDCYQPNPMALVAAIPFKSEESEWQKRFQKQLHRSEWFRLEGELLTFVQAMNGVLWDAFDYPPMEPSKEGPCLVVSRKYPERTRAKMFIGWRVSDRERSIFSSTYVLMPGGTWAGPFEVYWDYVREPDAAATSAALAVGSPAGLCVRPDMVGAAEDSLVRIKSDTTRRAIRVV